MTTRPHALAGMALPALVTLVALVLALICTPTNAVPVLRLMPAAQVVTLGQQAVVTVELSDTIDSAAPSIGSYDLNLAFDDGILAVADLAFDVFLGQPALSLTDFDFSVAGLLNLAEVSLLDAATLDSLQPDTFTLATLTFDTLSAGVSPLSWLSLLVGDAFGLPLQVLALSASITVVAAAAAPPTLTLAAAAVLAAWALRGRGRRLRPVSSDPAPGRSWPNACPAPR